VQWHIRYRSTPHLKLQYPLTNRLLFGYKRLLASIAAVGGHIDNLIRKREIWENNDQLWGVDSLLKAATKFESRNIRTYIVHVNFLFRGVMICLYYN
jgi:hypothetical protein